MIYLIITTSIINKHGIKDAEHRKKNYIDSINQTLKYLPNGIIPIIVENNGKRETFMDDFGIDVLYTNNNELSCRHKGINELCDIKDVIDKYKIEDNDIIIKITGRYHPTNDSFLKLVSDAWDKYDAFIKFFNVCELTFMENDCVLGAFAIKCKYIKEFEYVDSSKSPEVEFATFVRKNCESICEIENLNVRCCFADNLRILDV